MSYQNPFAITNQAQIEETIRISPIYTNRSQAESNLTSYDIIRVNLSEITLPEPALNRHIRIHSVEKSIVAVYASGAPVCEMFNEIVSFIYNGQEWVFFSSF